MERDLFPGFASRRLLADGAEVFVRIGGSGPAVLLVHGYPQTNASWHRIAPLLAEDHTVVACDLPGYGASGMPRPLPDSAEFAKRAMALTLVGAMEQLGFSRFAIVGHDRGARVAYRLALDHPQRVTALAVISIVPTFAMWSLLESNEYAMKGFRWFLLAQPNPFPERLLKCAGVQYLYDTLSGWTKAKDLSAFDPRALAAYEDAYSLDSTIAASCGDYRAGWTVDRLHDHADLESNTTISAPTIVIWGSAEFPDPEQVMGAWREIAPQAAAYPLDCGHFAPEEAPGEVLTALRELLQLAAVRPY